MPSRRRSVSPPVPSGRGGGGDRGGGGSLRPSTAELSQRPQESPGTAGDDNLLREAIPLDLRRASITNEESFELEDLLLNVGHDSSALWRAPPHFRANRYIVLQCVSRNGHALVYAHPGLQADRDVVRAAVQQDGGAIRYASDELKADESIVRIAVSRSGDALFYAADALKANKEVSRPLLLRTFAPLSSLSPLPSAWRLLCLYGS